MHVKRQTIAKSWPIPRKGTKYVVRASHNKKEGIPVLIILRDILKVAKNRKEAKKILQSKEVFVNGKPVKKEELAVLPFDIIKIGNKNYELSFSDKGKFILKEIEKKERILKVVDKKILKNKKMQVNLIFGKNIIYDGKGKLKSGDSVVIEKNKIVKIMPVENKRVAIIFSGKYRGREGEIEKIEGKIATLAFKNEKINVPIKNILVIR